jgi:hypothetical protein
VLEDLLTDTSEVLEELAQLEEECENRFAGQRERESLRRRGSSQRGEGGGGYGRRGGEGGELRGPAPPWILSERQREGENEKGGHREDETEREVMPRCMRNVRGVQYVRSVSARERERVRDIRVPREPGELSKLPLEL